MIFFSFLFVGMISAQTGVKGTIVNEYGEPIVGATVHDKTSDKAVVTDFDGNYTFELEAGEHEIEIMFVSFTNIDLTVNLSDGEMKGLGQMVMESSDIGIDAIKVIADRAKERETPVAFSDISKKDIDQQLGSRDIPLIMNVTPSVYATAQGGGAGDARINVRGFNQRNVAIMINGVPVNDMENGWVYWSNWDGLSDATSSIQMQRGMSAVNLATPSVGGTMNIITSPADLKPGASLKFEYGSGNFMKTTVAANSGLINDKFAVSASVVRKVGDGVVDATWTDAWAYYFGASYQINKKQRLEVFAMGAPQRHGQNLYRQNVAAYDTDFARSIGATDAADNITSEGRYWNENWNNVSESYTGKQWFMGKEHDRHNAGMLNERENFYHKPLVNLNWYSQWSNKVRQSTVLYYSGGTGGGTGTYGSTEWDYSGPSRRVDWDATIANNSVSDTAHGILRNSVNNQWTIGGLSRVDIHFSDDFKIAAGVDARTATIFHYREVRDLLGGQFFYYDGNQFESGEQYNKKIGDKIAYNFTNTVNWFGYFAQAEYSGDKITAYGTFGNSFIKYNYVNHFRKDENDESKELTAETEFMMGYQVKGGVAYRPIKQIKIFTNLGYISKAPIFDNVVNDRDGTVAVDPQNEIFEAVEAGVTYKTLDNFLEVSANYYYTLWLNRSLNIGVVNQDGTEGYIFVNGMDQVHQGFELETSIRPIKYIGFGVIGSMGNWNYLNDVEGTYKDYASGSEVEETYNFYVKGLKVGDAPQTQYAALIKIFPVKGLRLQVDGRYYDDYYADWSPFSRTTDDRTQVWKVPAYMLLDAHISYDFNIADKFGISVFGHMFNILDEVYVQDATDNSRYNAYPYGNDAHNASSAEVFLGLPRTFNVGMSVRF